MDKVTDTKNEFRLKQWTKIVQSCQSSGMKVTEWCRQNDINVKTYYYWLRKIRGMACEIRELAVHENEQPIVPLTFAQPKLYEKASITVHLSSVSIDIQNGASAETIGAVLAALKNIC